MRRGYASILMLLLLIGSAWPAIALGGDPKPPGGDDKGHAKAEDDFLIDLTPSSRIVPSGRLSIVRYAISVKAVGHFRERVELSLKGVPPGATGIIDKSYGVPTFATILTVIITPSAAEGVYTLTVIGRSGDIVHSAEAALVVGRGRNATSTATTTTTATAIATTTTGAQTWALMVSVGTNKQSYAQGDAVEIRGVVRDPFGNLVEGARVSIQVDGPSGGAVKTDLVPTDSTGSFSSGFTLPKDAQSGTYTVYVTASKEGYRDGRGQTSFSVGESQTPAVAIAALYLSDMGNATRSVFSPGETLIVWVVVRNVGAPLDRSVIWTEVDDPGGVPLMVQFQITAGMGRGAEVRAGFSLTLSADAYFGAYKVKAFVSDKMISEGGKFLASEVASFAVAPPESATTTTTTAQGGTTGATTTTGTTTTTTTTTTTATSASSEASTTATATTTTTTTTTTTATTTSATTTTAVATATSESATAGATTSETASTTQSG